MGNALQPAHLLLLLAIVLVLFGAAKLPALAKSLGQSARVFKGEMKAMKEDDAAAAEAKAAQASTAAQVAAPQPTDIVPPAAAQAEVLKNPENPI